MQYEEFRTQITLAANGRITLPSQLRGELSREGINRLVGIAARGGMWLFTPEDYRQIVKGRVRSDDPFSAPTSNFLRAVVSTNQTLSIDGHGRVLLPSHLRQLAGLERDLVMFSSLDWIEVWDKGRWDRMFTDALEAWDAEPAPGEGE